MLTMSKFKKKKRKWYMNKTCVMLMLFNYLKRYILTKSWRNAFFLHESKYEKHVHNMNWIYVHNVEFNQKFIHRICDAMKTMTYVLRMHCVWCEINVLNVLIFNFEFEMKAIFINAYVKHKWFSLLIVTDWLLLNLKNLLLFDLIDLISELDIVIYLDFLYLAFYHFLIISSMN